MAMVTWTTQPAGDALSIMHSPWQYSRMAQQDATWSLPVIVSIGELWWKIATGVKAFVRCGNLGCLISPNAKAVQRIRAECRGDGNVCGVATSRDQNPANPRHIIPGVERVPLASQIRFKPSCEIARRIGRWCADIAEISGAVARGNVQSSTKRHSQMGKVAAYAAPFLVGFSGRSRDARMLVAEGDASMNEIADGLHARPSRLRAAEERPSQIEQSIAIAVSTCNQETESVVQKLLDRRLHGIWECPIRPPAVPYDRIRRNRHGSAGSNKPTTSVRKDIFVTGHRHARFGHNLVGALQIRNARRMHIQHQDDERGLRKMINELVPNPEFHAPTNTWVGSII